MPLDLEIIRANEFVRMGARGHFSFAETRTALLELAHACRKRGLDRALVDLRELPIPPKPLFTPTQIAELVGTFREAGFKQHQRLAVLYRSDPHYGARIFALISRMRGWKVQAFEEFEPALFWLSQEESGKAEPGEQRISIRPAKGKAPVGATKGKLHLESN